jgi:drug/metabolite transporter (DMT)-like permease
LKAGHQRLALLAAMATGVQVGAAMVATRFLSQDIGPASLALLRYAIGVACLLPFLPAHLPLRMARGDLVAVMGLGILQFGVLIALLNFGLITLPASRAALLFATFPLLTMVVAAGLGREGLTAAKTAGVLLSFAGVAITLGEDLLAAAGDGEWIGALAILAAALCGAVCSVLYRPYLQRCPTLPVGVLAMFAAVLFLAPLAAAEGFFAKPTELTAPGWGAVVFIGLSSGAGYLLWLWALKHASPTRVTVFLSLSPVTAAVLGVLLLGETLTLGMAIGLAAVIGGLWIATRFGGEEGAKASL